MTEPLKEVSLVQKETDKNRFLIYGPEKDPTEIVKENYLSELFATKLFNPSTNVQDKAFQDTIGEPHPFDYELVEQVAMKFGLIPAVIDKISDYTLGPGINVYSENEKETEILNKVIKVTRLRSHLRPWFNEGLLKGMGYMECAGLNDINAEEAIKCVNADTIYIQRNEQGEVEKYNQYFGNLNKRASMGSAKDIPEIDKDTIIPIEINKFGSSPYGMGIVYGGLPMVNDFLNSQSSAHKLMNRKANNPIHVKVGNVQNNDYPEQSELNNIGQKLQYMNHSTEYVTGPNVEMNVLNFGDVVGKFEGILKNDLKLLSYHFQVPESVLGSDRGYAGAAEMQDSGFMRQIKSYQEQITDILSSKLFDKILLKHGITEPQYRIVFGKESDAEKNAVRSTYAQLLSGSINLSVGMRKQYEQKLAELDEIDYSVVEEDNEAEELKPKPEMPQQGKPFSFGQKKEGEEPEEEPEKPEEHFNEGWVTGKDGRHYYIGDDGKSYSGKQAIDKAKSEREKEGALVSETEVSKKMIKQNIDKHKNLFGENDTKIEIAKKGEIYEENGKTYFGTAKYNSQNDKITFYPMMIKPEETEGVVLHELGHSKMQKFSSGQIDDWKKIATKSTAPTAYAKTHIEEDFAESVRLYFSGNKNKINTDRINFIEKIKK